MLNSFEEMRKIDITKLITPNLEVVPIPIMNGINYVKTKSFNYIDFINILLDFYNNRKMFYKNDDINSSYVKSHYNIEIVFKDDYLFNEELVFPYIVKLDDYNYKIELGTLYWNGKIFEKGFVFSFDKDFNNAFDPNKQKSFVLLENGKDYIVNHENITKFYDNYIEKEDLKKKIDFFNKLFNFNLDEKDVGEEVSNKFFKYNYIRIETRDIDKYKDSVLLINSFCDIHNISNVNNSKKFIPLVNMDSLLSVKLNNTISHIYSFVKELNLVDTENTNQSDDRNICLNLYDTLFVKNEEIQKKKFDLGRKKILCNIEDILFEKLYIQEKFFKNYF